MIKNLRSNQILAHQVEILTSAKQRSIGLLKYDKAPADFGAIFVLPLRGFFPAVHTFGMKFSIDIVYCNAEGEVLSVLQNIKANRFVLSWKYLLGGCRFLMEFPAGLAKDLQIRDRLEWRGL